MEETIKRIVRVEDYCRDNGIADVDKFRNEMKPFRCVIKIRGVDYFSPTAFDDGVLDEFVKRRTKMMNTEKRQTGEYSYHKRIVTTSPKWIAGKNEAIAKAAEKLAGTTNPDERFKEKQKLIKLRDDLVRMEKAYADSREALTKILADADAESQSA